MNKSLTPHFDKFIDQCLASGRYNNRSEVIRAGLRLLEEQERKLGFEVVSTPALEQLLDEGMEVPNPCLTTDDLRHEIGQSK
jgi:antitoxin ParD1/3/4